MKKSTTIKLTLLASAAMLATGCNRSEARRCVDQEQRIVGDEFCDPNGGISRRGGGVHYWMYGGSGRGIGDRVVGGSVAPSSGGSVSSSGVSRGGFGSSMHAGS